MHAYCQKFIKIICFVRRAIYVFYEIKNYNDEAANITFTVFMLYNVFFSYRVLNGAPLEHLWYQVKAVVDHANPTHTYTLQAHTFRESNY